MSNKPNIFILVHVEKDTYTNSGKDEHDMSLWNTREEVADAARQIIRDTTDEGSEEQDSALASLTAWQNMTVSNIEMTWFSLEMFGYSLYIEPKHHKRGK